MGCIFEKLFGKSDSVAEDKENTGEEQPQYSWDKRTRVDPKDFTIENLIDGVEGRAPGKINGQQFIIQNCQNSLVYLYDHVNMITVDDCTNCSFIIGPVKTSIFVRDCKECKFVVACQQFRTRDCHRLDVSLACVSQPIIEASSKIRFGPYELFYPELEGQFQAAGLSPYNCLWSDVHDFTPVTGEEPNFALLSPNSGPVVSPAPLPPTSSAADGSGDRVDGAAGDGVGACLAELRVGGRWLVPRTQGKRRWEHEGERCLMVVMPGSEQGRLARELIQGVCSMQDCVVMETRHTKMQPNEAANMFGSDHYDAHVMRGPLITLDFSGPNIIPQCLALAEQLVGGEIQLNDRLFISRDPESTRSCLNALYNLVTMQMNTQ